MQQPFQDRAKLVPHQRAAGAPLEFGLVLAGMNLLVADFADIDDIRQQLVEARLVRWSPTALVALVRGPAFLPPAKLLKLLGQPRPRSRSGRPRCPPSVAVIAVVGQAFPAFVRLAASSELNSCSSPSSVDLRV